LIRAFKSASIASTFAFDPITRHERCFDRIDANGTGMGKANKCTYGIESAFTTSCSVLPFTGSRNVNSTSIIDILILRGRVIMTLQHGHARPGLPAHGRETDVEPEVSWWAVLDLNQRPKDYESSALTN
jgi:hypothetical protein